jgi:hypothetical protein
MYHQMAWLIVTSRSPLVTVSHVVQSYDFSPSLGEVVAPAPFPLPAIKKNKIH